jgi:hypothetical protein
LEEVNALQNKTRVDPRKPDNILFGHCCDIAYMFEGNWADIGYKLQCLRGNKDATTEDLRKALEPLSGKYRYGLIWLLLRASASTATSRQLRKTYKELVRVSNELQKANQEYETQAQRCQEADSAVREASPEHRKELQKSITWRIENRIRLRRERDAKKKMLAGVQRDLARALGQKEMEAEAAFTNARAEFERSEEALATEEDILKRLGAAHALATPDNWTFAKTKAAERRSKLEVSANQLQTLKTNVQRVDAVYRDQGALFATRDLLKFVVKKRALHEPRQLAKAVAGLPDMPCRESFRRCKRCQFPEEHHTNYQLFKVIEKAWSRRNPLSPSSDLHALFEEEIQNLRKTTTWQKTKMPNLIRSRFEEHRRELRKAIKHCIGLGSPRGEIPYIMTAKFIQFVAETAQMTNLERILLEREEGD